MRSLFGALVFVAAVACASGPTVAEADGPATLTLVHQELALQPDATLTIAFHPPEPIGPDTVRVLAYPPVTDRDGFRGAVTNHLSGSIDRVDVDPSTTTPDGDGNITLAIATESASSSQPALRFSQPGVYPLAVQVIDAAGKVAAQLVTFVDRLPTADAPQPDQLGVAVLASITAPPRLPGTSTPLPASVVAELADLANYPPGLAVSVAISPEILGRVDPATITALRTVLADGTILSQPRVPFDPSAATAAGLDDRFTQLLVDGEKAVVTVGELPQPDRTVWFAPAGITNAAALHLRDLNVRLLVITSDTYLHSTGMLGGFTDYSQLFETVLPGEQSTTIGQDSPDTSDPDSSAAGPPDAAPSGTTCASDAVACIPTAAIDPVLSSRLSDPDLSDEQAALYTVADIVVYRDYLIGKGLSPNNPHALVLGLNGDGVPNAQRIARIAEMTPATNAVKYITLDSFAQNSSQLINDGNPLELQLPQPTPIDLHTRDADLKRLSLIVPTVASMIVPAAGSSDGRVDGWNNTIQTLYSSSITDAEAAVAEQRITTALDTIKACVVPPTPYSFTLTGRTTNLPLRLTNTCSEKLQVVVHLEAPAGKMEFSPNDQTIVLEPNGPTIFTVPATARTNGSFDVTLDVLTPVGHIAVTKTLTLKASINTLTGLPQVLTGAGLLILLTWWLRNQRRSRRARRSAATMTGDHPRPVPDDSVTDRVGDVSS